MASIKTIIHIFGTMCSGKSFLLRNIDKDQIFDVLDVYRKLGFTQGKDAFPKELKRARRDIIRELNAFAKVNHRVIFVESSGMNKTVNKWLRRMSREHNVIELGIKPPTETELKLYALKRGLPFTRVDAFRRHWRTTGRLFNKEEIETFMRNILND